MRRSSPTSATRRRASALDGPRSCRPRATVIGDLADAARGRDRVRGARGDGRSATRRSRAGGVELVPRTGLVERLRAVKEPDGARDDPRRPRRSRTRVFGALAEERFVGRTERDLAWRMRASCSTSTAPTSSRSTPIVASAENGARPHAEPGDARSGRDTLVIDRRGLPASTATRPTARARSRPASCRRSSRARTTSASRRRWRPRGDPAGRQRARRRRGRAGRDRRRPASASSSATGSATGSGLEVHEAPALAAGVADDARGGQRRHGRAGDLPAGRRRRPDRGPGRRHGRRPRAADAVPEGARHRRLECWPADGRRSSPPTVQERHAHRDRRPGLADRRVPAREARQGRGVRAHEAEDDRRPAPSSTGPSAPARSSRASHRGQEHAVPLRLRRRGRLHGRGDLRADPLPHASVEDELPFMLPSSSVQMLFVDGRPSGVQLPASVELRSPRPSPA